MVDDTAVAAVEGADQRSITFLETLITHAPQRLASTRLYPKPTGRQTRKTSFCCGRLNVMDAPSTDRLHGQIDFAGVSLSA